MNIEEGLLVRIEAATVAGDDLEWAERCSFWCASKASKQSLRKRYREDRSPLILTGHGVRLRVDHGALVVRDGFTHYPQEVEEQRFFPGARDLPSRIIVIDGSGGLSFAVMTWLSDQRIPFFRIDYRGKVLTVMDAAANGTNPKLVGAQLDAQRSERRLQISIALVRAKLVNSVATLDEAFSPSSAVATAQATLRSLIEQLDNETPLSLDALRGVEGKAAKAYYTAWLRQELQWTGVGRHPIPESWYRIGFRQSETGGKLGKNKRASHPVNAILNYAYALLESHVRTQVIAQGYDPTIGFLHSSQPERPALVLDLMEPLRPIVDRIVLDLVRSSKFRPADFVLRSDGVCRLNPEMARIVSRSTLMASDQLAIEVSDWLSSKPIHRRS